MIALLSLGFISFSIVTVLIVSLLSGAMRQSAFLAANLAFAWAVIGTVGIFSTVVFCLLGYVLVLAHMRWQKLNPALTLVVFVALFAYMRNYEILQWLLPDDVGTDIFKTIGLSFILFRIIHVMTDARSGTLGNLNLATYLNYCLSFMTFMMGPIQRYQDFHDQWHGHQHVIAAEFEVYLDVMLRIMVGFIKIYVLAAWFESIALKSDADVLQLSPLAWVVQLYAFYFYLYLNFAGYCDVVIGIGLLLGLRIPENFNFPYISRNISEFWQRQHRSLTLWLTDYVFSPAYKRALSSKWLSSRPLLAVNISLMLTMLVSGLWHGTTIGFLVFGLLHGLYLVIYHSWDHTLVRLLGRRRLRLLRKNWLISAGGIFLTFNATSFAFMFFRLDTPRILQLVADLSVR